MKGEISITLLFCAIDTTTSHIKIMRLNPYELRMDCLRMAQTQLDKQYEILKENSPEEEIPYPSIDELLRHANTLREFMETH